MNKIIITHDGTTTIARLYDGKKVMKSAEAKCAPSDAFDFTIGANLAYDRLMDRLPATPPKPAEKPAQEPIKLYCVKDFMEGNFLTRGKVYEFVPGKGVVYDDEWCGGDTYGGSFAQYARYNPSLSACLIPLVQRPAKVGEWVYIANRMLDSKNSYANGDVCQVVSADGSGAFIRTLTGKTHNCNVGDGTAFLYHSEYLVLDGYEPEPEYYKGKVVCIKAFEGFTAGKVYCFTDGVCGDNDGDKRPESGRRPIRDLSDGWARDIFIEFKGEAQ